MYSILQASFSRDLSIVDVSCYLFGIIIIPKR